MYFSVRYCLLGLRELLFGLHYSFQERRKLRLHLLFVDDDDGRVAAAIAVAPVTQWEFYDSIYTEVHIYRHGVVFSWSVGEMVVC